LTVLDVGCGAGAVLLSAASAVGPTGRVIGIDLAEGMVERARRAARERGLENVEGRAGDAENPALAERSVAAVVASLVLFFLPHIDLALDAYARTLVVGGTLAFSTFGGDDDWTPIDEILEGFASPPVPPNTEEPWFQTRDGIRSTLQAHGFS